MEVSDVETFVAEIEARPAIWDSRCGSYSDRNVRISTWYDLCAKLVPSFTSKSAQERHSIATHFQRRWKSLRDCFKREHTKQMQELKNPSEVSTRRPYKYYEILSFLANVMDDKREHTPEHALIEPKRPKQEEEEDVYFEYEMPEAEPEIINNFTEAFNRTQTEEEEADRNFALSLIPHFKRIPPEQKLDAQMEILMVLKKFKGPDRQAHGPR